MISLLLIDYNGAPLRGIGRPFFEGVSIDLILCHIVITRVDFLKSFSI